VFRDLMAYSCTFEHCDAGLFESRAAWKAHELAEHRRDWRCPSCRLGFVTRDLVEGHIIFEHGPAESVLVHELNLITAASSQHMTAKISDCPFCDDHHARSSLLHLESDTVQHKQGLQELQVSVDVYQRHLSRHMEQLALFAVPPADTASSDDDDSDTSEDDDDEDRENEDGNSGGEDYEDEDEDSESEPGVPDSVLSNAPWFSSLDVKTILSGGPDHDGQRQVDSEAQPCETNIDKNSLFVCPTCQRVVRNASKLRYGM